MTVDPGKLLPDPGRDAKLKTALESLRKDAISISVFAQRPTTAPAMPMIVGVMNGTTWELGLCLDGTNWRFIPFP